MTSSVTRGIQKGPSIVFPRPRSNAVRKLELSLHSNRLHVRVSLLHAKDWHFTLTSRSRRYGIHVLTIGNTLIFHVRALRSRYTFTYRWTTGLTLETMLQNSIQVRVSLRAREMTKDGE